MKRRAIQLANNTLVVSLPARWVQQNSIAKGEDIEVDAKERALIITKASERGAVLSRASIDMTGMNASLVWNYLNAAYRAGFSEIEVIFDEQEIKDIKAGKKVKTLDLLSRITDKMIGMEIIGQSRRSCTIKEITQLKGEEYDNVANRIFLSLATISDDVVAALRDGDAATLENIHAYSEINLNKLSDYCMRILNTAGIKETKESNVNYLVTFLLEEVGDVYAEIARVAASGQKRQIDADMVSFFEKTNELLLLSHRFFLNPKREYYISFHEQRNALKKRIVSAGQSGRRAESEMAFLLKLVLDRLMEVNNAVVTMRPLV
jgi:phosphate uptake regulator